MGKFDGVLLASDFDDTYYSNEGVVAPANLEALAYFEAQGGRFTISTGRAHRTFAPLLHLTPVNAPVILANGAQLYDFEKEELLAEFTMPDTAAAVLEDKGVQHNAVVWYLDAQGIQARARLAALFGVDQLFMESWAHMPPMAEEAGETPA